MLTLILGGARSGKSDLAQRLAEATGADVLFVATLQPGDEEMRERIAAHRAARPAGWTTVEAPLDVVGVLADDRGSPRCVVVDCLTVWISNILLDEIGDVDEISIERARAALTRAANATADLFKTCQVHPGDVIIVSNEAGMGVVPAYPLGRLFRDALGAANRAIAARADRVYYLVAGLVLDVKALGATSIERFGEDPP